MRLIVLGVAVVALARCGCGRPGPCPMGMTPCGERCLPAGGCGCGLTCSAGTHCLDEQGQCVPDCPEGKTACSDSFQEVCADLSSDIAHCGACDTPCIG